MVSINAEMLLYSLVSRMKTYVVITKFGLRVRSADRGAGGFVEEGDLSNLMEHVEYSMNGTQLKDIVGGVAGGFFFYWELKNG